MKELSYFLMVLKLWTGDWKDQIDQMNQKVNEDNGRGGTQENGRFRKLRRFSRKKIWKNTDCFMSAPTFGLGGLRLWEKDLKIRGKNRKRSLIQSKVYLYEVCASLFQFIYYHYYFYTNTYFLSVRFVASITLGERILGSIGQEALSWRETRRKMIGGR